MAGLTKQHFESIAKIIKSHNYKGYVTVDGSDSLILDIMETKIFINNLSNYFKTQNPLFNENQFKKACLE